MHSKNSGAETFNLLNHSKITGLAAQGQEMVRTLADFFGPSARYVTMQTENGELTGMSCARATISLEFVGGCGDGTDYYPVQLQHLTQLCGHEAITGEFSREDLQKLKNALPGAMADTPSLATPRKVASVA